jgi:membrane protein DedA with SNARE-associated domain
VNVDALLETIPPLAVYVVVGFIIGLESLGIPLPGEIALVSAALLASRHTLDISPVWVGAAATCGAVIGDSIGYSIGRKFGMSLFERLGKRFPKHFGPGHVALAKQLFARWGVWAVFFGRFVALLRIFAGPMAGMLRMHYPRFLAANAAGGVAWSTAIGVVAYKVGDNADEIFGRVSLWALIGIAVAVVAAYVVHRVRRRRHAPVVTERASADV